MHPVAALATLIATVEGNVAAASGAQVPCIAANSAQHLARYCVGANMSEVLMMLTTPTAMLRRPKLHWAGGGSAGRLLGHH
jgi:hypothetical protein